MIVYAMKVKVCSSCDKIVPKLWKSSPALCKDCAMRIKAKEAVSKQKTEIRTITWDENESMELINVEAGDEITVSNAGKYVTCTIKRKPVKKSGDEYKEFFESLTIPERCEECNQVLLAFNNFGRRCVSAHILNKASFKSVAKHPDNILYLGASILGACSCHNFYDSCIENRKSMRVYKVALARLESFKHLLTDKELVMAEKYLGINQINNI